MRAPRRTPSNSLASRASTTCPCFARSACFSRAGRPLDAARSPTGSRTCAAASNSLREQNVLIFDGLLKIALAEAEARAGDPDRAVAILDEALATCDRTGYRAFEAELHRARGEILLKRDPANPAPAEEAFQTAIASREAASHAQLRTARGAVARQALPIDRPPRRRPRRPRARARRLFADAGNAGDRRGAGAAGGAGTPARICDAAACPPHHQSRHRGVRRVVRRR